MTTAGGGPPVLVDDLDVPRVTLADGVPEQRRGPMRPQQLRNMRERHSRRLDAHTFRTLDLVLLITLTSVNIRDLNGGHLGDVTVVQAAPFVVGGLALARLLRAQNLYRFGRNERLSHHVGRVVVCTLIASTSALLVSELMPSTGPGVRSIAVWTALVTFCSCVLHTTWWTFVRRWRSQGWLTPNVVIVGATAHAEDLIRDALAHRDMHVLGIFDDRLERSPLALLGVPVLGDTHALLTHKVTPFVDLVVVAVDPAATARVREITARLSVLPNTVCLIFDQDTTARRAAAISNLADSPLAPLNTALDSDRRAFAKRLQDLVISIPVLLAALPMMALVALAIRFDSPGPVFFRQRRHGFNNEEILVWKFRTMRHETADHRAARQVSANDDRVTRVGRILRTTSLDELPQLFNVVKGEMSLVGPRPHAIGMRTGDTESAQLVAEYAHRHRIKPGMTGWAAIRGSRGPLHHADDVSRRVELDVDYIDRQSFWLDLKIMMLTVPSVLGDRSAIR